MFIDDDGSQLHISFYSDLSPIFMAFMHIGRKDLLPKLKIAERHMQAAIKRAAKADELVEFVFQSLSSEEYDKLMEFDPAKEAASSKRKRKPALAEAMGFK